jgi:membrane-associated phospholipid phosphatase
VFVPLLIAALCAGDAACAVDGIVDSVPQERAPVPVERGLGESSTGQAAADKNVQAGSYTSADWWTTAALIGAGLGFDAWPDPSACRWCDKDESGADTLNGFDRSVRSSWIWTDANRGKANTLSWVTEFAPFAFLIPHGGRAFQEDAIPVLQAFGVTYVATDAVKIAAARQRPFVHFAEPGVDVGVSGANKSFFSGHASGVFSTVFALARVYSDRQDPQTRWVWIVGLPVAAYTGYLRIAADKHYATDVLTGAAAGSVLGWIVPGYVKHRQAQPSARYPTLGVSAHMITARWVW